MTSPNHYELLGLPILESDVNAITAAADRAMSKVRACMPGANAAAWAKLLDDISAAKDCLTNAEQKSAYDQKLQLGEVREAASMALGNPNMYPPDSLQAAADKEAATPATAAPAAPVPNAYQQPAAAVPNPMDPMAPVPMAVPGMPSPLTPELQIPSPTPTYAQPVPQALSTPVAPVAQAIPVAPTPMPAQQPMAIPQAAPAALPVQPVAPVQHAMAQAMPAPVYPSPMVQQPQAEAVAAAAATQPGVKRKRSATAMAMQRSSSSVILPILVGGGVGMVVLLVVGVAFFLGKSELAVNDREVATVAPSPPVVAPTRVLSSELPQAAVIRETSPTVPDPLTSPQTSPSRETPASQPSPEPEPSPTPSMLEPEPEDTGPTREELRALAQSLTNARAAIGEQNFTVLDAELAKAEGLVKADDHKAKLRRLTLLADYVKKFREAIDKTIAGLEVGAQVPYNESVTFGVVEKGPNLLIVRVAGQNRRYALNDLQPGLARRLGEMSLVQGSPETLALQAAFISVMPKAGDADLEKARGWWEQASTVPDVQDLITAINDDYSLQQDLAKVPLDPNAMDQLTGFMERLKDARTVEEFAKEYQSAIDDGLKKLEPEMELEVGGSTIVTIEEVQSDRIMIQIAGLKRGLRRDDLPLGFAAAIAAQTIPRDVPLAMVMKGAYYAARDGEKKQFRPQVLAWWNAAGEANQDLQPVILELAKQYPE
ncbi:MAG: hypothetical protein CMJ64_20615 [Planctomycetaceae bacterium]|nr:hypothetical protein [Planctomycetaceae bacterium]